MKKIGKMALLYVTVMLVSCGSPKNLISYSDKAMSEAAAGNGAAALEAWKQYFDTHELESIPGEFFAKAAGVALEEGNTDLALNWFDQARYKNFADPEMYLALARINKDKNNLSKELSALEYYYDHFSVSSDAVNERLFGLYTEINEPAKAEKIWQGMSIDLKQQLPVMEKYFALQVKAENAAACDTLAQQILEKDGDNLAALDWLAKKYYWLGEKHYHEELARYEKNKTTRQYKILLKELDKAGADLKIALGYLEKLWDIKQSKEYASFLASIYGRFGDQKKVDYYKGFMEQ